MDAEARPKSPTSPAGITVLNLDSIIFSDMLHSLLSDSLRGQSRLLRKARKIAFKVPGCVSAERPAAHGFATHPNANCANGLNWYMKLTQPLNMSTKKCT